MLAVDKAKERLLRLYLDELGRARRRVDELREKYPSATTGEMVQRLTDAKKTWAGTGGAVSGLFGLLSLPADIALVTALQLSLIMEIALLHRVNLKSERARQEVLDLLGYANGIDQFGVAARTGPKLVAKVAQVLLARKGLVSLGRAVPVLAAPISAHINSRDIQRAGGRDGAAVLRDDAQSPRPQARRAGGVGSCSSRSIVRGRGSAVGRGGRSV